VNLDRQSIVLLAVGIVIALTVPWLLLDRRVRPSSNGASRADVRPSAAAQLLDAAVR
jgi:hypothetical protein